MPLARVTCPRCGHTVDEAHRDWDTVSTTGRCPRCALRFEPGMAALEVTGPAPYKDRHTGLIVVGMLNVFIGLCGLGAAMGVLDLMLGGSAPARAAGHSPALPLRDLLPWLTYLLVFAVGFVWLGIGSMMARRWARTLLQIVFWLWLLGGVVICL